MRGISYSFSMMGMIKNSLAGILGLAAVLSAPLASVWAEEPLESIAPAESTAPAVETADIDYQVLEILYRQGRAALNQADYLTAQMAADALLAEDPMYVDALVLRGQINREQGQQRTAYDHYDAALQVDPDHVLAKSYLGQLFLDIGRVDRAKLYLTELDEQCPFGCGPALMLERAITDFEAGLWTSPTPDEKPAEETE